MLIEHIGQHPVFFAAIVGAIAGLILPIISLFMKIDYCNYGWDNDYSGVCICLPSSVVIGAALAAFGGIVGKLIGQLLEDKTDVHKPHLIGGFVGGVLGGLVGLLVSTIPAFLFAFPDC